MNDNEQTIHAFYTAFQKRDAAAMVACYHPEVRFSDPVFPDLRGPRAGLMWRMLCERGADLKVEFRDVKADDRRGSAHWDARYTYSGTGRAVLNQIDAAFELEGGRIIRHTDSFDLYRWARQALGPVGLLLGWTPMVQGKIRRTAAAALDRFEAGQKSV
ncbi:MAG TPA: nuclear transport factor 2 family protein [Kofleriaceae bacterium]|nr:nuclear transport factor 2 family protein [Kofleriaceae bacterium]